MELWKVPLYIIMIEPLYLLADLRAEFLQWVHLAKEHQVKECTSAKMDGFRHSAICIFSATAYLDIKRAPYKLIMVHNAKKMAPINVSKIAFSLEPIYLYDK